jgi:hypothetical protein
MLGNINAYHRETPDFDVSASTKELLQVPRLRFRVATIPVDGIDDELCFTLIEEMPRSMGFVREVDQRPVSNNAQKAGECTFNNENPSSRD